MVLALPANICFANYHHPDVLNKDKKEIKAKKVIKPKPTPLSRQCCTKSFIDASSGVAISVTACAGWFLSNDAAALTRACEKADAAAEEFLAL